MSIPVQRALITNTILAISVSLSACSTLPPRPTQTQPPPPTAIAEPTATLPPAPTLQPSPTSRPVEFKSADPTTFVYATYGDPLTLDPALNYDTTGGEIIQNVYDMLFFFKASDPATLVPQLATEIPTEANGGIQDEGKTYVFKIRSGVQFHKGGILTAEDVAYTFQRGLLQGGSASPQWLLAQPVLGLDYFDVAELVDPAMVDDPGALSSADSQTLREVCQRVTAAFVPDNNAGTVTVHLAQPWSPFVATLAQYWGSIQQKTWVIANGGWDGNCATWQNYYGKTEDDLRASGLGITENGTGPFSLDHWTPGKEIVLAANEHYWRTEPAWDGGPAGSPALKKVVFKLDEDFDRRLAMFKAGEADMILLGSSEQYPQLDALVGETCGLNNDCTLAADPAKGVRRYQNLPTIARDDVFFTFQVTSDDNPYIGSGQLDGNGIPPDFFSDIHIRRAFAYCFDWERYIREVQQGEGVQSINVMLPGELGYEPDGAHYSNNPEQCEAEFKASVWKSETGQSLWEAGFRLVIPFNTGSTQRQSVARIFQEGIAAVNPKFIIEIADIPGETIYNDSMESKLPVMLNGWIEDIPDPYNWTAPYSIGFFGGTQQFPPELTEQFKDILNRAIAESNPSKRAAIYKEFNQLFYEEVPTLLLAVQQGRVYQQRWIHGYYYNPIFAGLYLYPISKQ